jgi:secreted trypsin-like serine protease
MTAWWWKLCALAAMVAACVGCVASADEESEPLGTTEEAITNGNTDNKDYGVVALLVSGQVYCSGVLVTPYVVATAAHCMEPTPPDQVFFGANPSEKGGIYIKVANTLEHPNFDVDTLDNDIALVGLASKAPATPLSYRTQAFDNSFDAMSIRIVGFGTTSAMDGSARKHSGNASIESFSDGDFKMKPDPSQTCTGDSGGPAFATFGNQELVIGLTSSGDASCQTYGRDMRIDRYVGFIQSYTRAYHAPIATKSGGCAQAPGSSPPSSSALLLMGAMFIAAKARRHRRPLGRANARCQSGRA